MRVFKDTVIARKKHQNFSLCLLVLNTVCRIFGRFSVSSELLVLPLFSIVAYTGQITRARRAYP